MFGWDITKQVAGALIRWLLFSVGAWLVKHNVIDQQMADAWLNEITAGILGGILILIPIIWKILNARFNILSLIKAVQTSPPADDQGEINAAVKDAQAAATADPRLTLSA